MRTKFPAPLSARSWDLWLLETAPRKASAAYDIAVCSHGDIRRLQRNLSEAEPAFDMGCLQDVFLGILAVSWHKAGDWSLHDPLSKHLPELGRGAAPGDRIVIGDLLSHSSGIWLENAPQPDPALANWDRLVEHIIDKPLAFPPGEVVVYSIVERVLLVQAMSRALGRNIYAHLEDQFVGCGSGLAFSACPPEHGVGLQTLRGSIHDLMAHLIASVPDWWWPELPDPDGRLPTHAGGCLKARVPRALRWGMLDYGNGIWGQNGQSPGGSIGMRALAPTGEFVIGWFPTQQERDVTLGGMAERLAKSEYGEDDRCVGSLGRFAAEDLTGVYVGLSIKLLRISVDRDELKISVSGEKTAEMRFRIDERGYLYGRFPNPSLWIEPVSLPRRAAPGLRFGLHVFDRLDGDHGREEFVENPG